MNTIENKRLFIKDDVVDWEETAPGLKRKIMAWDDRIMLVKVAFEKGAVGTLHSHPHTQISYVESGVFEIEISGEKSVLKTGEVFYVPPHAVHGAVCLEAGLLIDTFSPMREDFVKQQHIDSTVL
ncbi:MAG TPA: cupin domain-containing protein [Flavisolibacter sp.]|jgi:quercetin dioxygenase-like cupin family protein|nr:cupin domain-containing protein [Flavisolibacter sp.]